jgi:hypothetical protein
MKFNVSDLALTRNSNSLVVILQINRLHSHPYLIARIDGAPIGIVGAGADVEIVTPYQIWCCESLLRNHTESSLLEDCQVYGLPDECQIAAFNAYEQAIQQLPDPNKHQV